MKIEIQSKLVEFISDCLNQTSEECIKVGCFLFAVFALNNISEEIILYDELIYGWCVEKEGIINTVVSSTGLTEYQIENGLVELVKLGIFNISINRNLRQVKVQLKNIE
jgi:hypothetical protein